MLALLTGAGSLIGEGVARVLAADGWDLVLTDIDLTNVEPVAKDLGAVGTEVLDVRSREQAKAVIDDVERRGPIDALVNLAGGMVGLGVPSTAFAESHPDDWATVLDTNLGGVLNCSHAMLPHMIDRRRGSIVNLTAGRGLRGGRNAAIYSAAKAAIIVFTQSLALEVGESGIRVNSVAPGSAEVRRAKPAPPRSVLGRHATGADVGYAVAFLLSERASHVTGSCFDVSGGTALH